MKNFGKNIFKFVETFNFCFFLLLFIFALSLFLAFYFHNMWYLVLAGLDVAFYASFYLMFTMLLDYYSVIDEQQKLYQDVEELKDLVERSLSNQFSKEQVIDFTKVNINNKIK